MTVTVWCSMLGTAFVPHSFGTEWERGNVSKRDDPHTHRAVGQNDERVHKE
uniref:Uncharacterized protein n=1 Tax=Anopheles minimus TaxID=112268 RepID=A0A182WMX7_9DIPT